MADSLEKTKQLPRRLCSEIQLFDLCDLDTCLQKNGRFCTDTELLGQFEKTAENELRIPEHYISEEFDADDMNDEIEFGDDSEIENFEEEDDDDDDDFNQEEGRLR